MIDCPILDTQHWGYNIKTLFRLFLLSSRHLQSYPAPFRYTYHQPLTGRFTVTQKVRSSG